MSLFHCLAVTISSLMDLCVEKCGFWRWKVVSKRCRWYIVYRKWLWEMRWIIKIRFFNLDLAGFIETQSLSLSQYKEVVSQPLTRLYYLSRKHPQAPWTNSVELNLGPLVLCHMPNLVQQVQITIKVGTYLNRKKNVFHGDVNWIIK